MASKLVFTHAGRREERLLQGRSVKVGRDPGNAIVIGDEKMSVSRFHARFDFDGRHWRVVDTKSTNRVRVNDEMIEPDEAGARLLNDGDRIVLGEFPVQFVREESGLALEDQPFGEQTARHMITSRMRDLPGLLESAAEMPREAQQAVERARRMVSVVTGLAQRIAAVTPVDDIIEAIVDLVFETTPAERAGLFLWDEETARLVPKRARARAGTEPGTMLASESLVRRAFAEKVTVHLDPQASPSASASRLQLRSAVAVPLLDESKAVGVIYADSSLHKGAFDAFEVSLLSALANHAAIALEQSRLLRRIRREERARAKLERFLARGVVDRILATGESSPGMFSMQADEAEVTVLFCDMAGFTARSEGLAPHAVLALLNRYFSRMTEVILEQEGTLDKYIGDCIMAVFGAPQAQPDHARRAALAALGMREAIKKANEEAPPEAKVEFRMGMHSGRVIAGDVGHVTRRDWTVLGATVNLASRLESSVAANNQIALTGETRALLGGEFETKPIAVTKPLKGILRNVEAFELVAARFEWDWSKKRR
jgi:adenylate cyclase